ncbi:MAG: hypothetical protein OJF50_002448 [Nitrospira sp.]|jgi:hypothetical protein|nr:hypothetical protein [Nitrospira sp.]
MSFIGNPQDVLTTSSTLNGQFSPETAVAEQALNRKRLIANLMMQQGLQGAPAGQMVGRFYVPSSPLQGASHLLQAGLGAYLGNRINNEQNDLASKDRQSVIDAITAYKNALKPRQVTDAAPPAPAAPLPPQEPPGQPMPTEPFRGIAPRPDGPYSGEVGAAAMPDVGVQSAAPPIPAPMRDSIAGQEQMRGLDMGNVQPADMSQFASSGGPAPQAPPMPQAAPPLPPPQTTPRMAGPTDEDRRNALIDLMTHAHPQVQRFGAMEFQRMQQETEHNEQRQALKEERGMQREFLGNENQLNRENQRNIADARLDQAVMLGLITKDQKDQMMAMQDSHNKAIEGIQKQQLDTTAAHNKSMEGIQRMNAETQRMQLAQGKVPPGYRATNEGNLEAIPGGPADTKLQGVFNQDTSQLNSSTAHLDRLSSTVNQLLNHPGIAGITGIRGKVPDIPGTDAANARALMQTLKSQVAFDVLQDMRNNSKTGGALGNVSDAEGKRLENNLAALDTTQSTDALKKQLRDILDFSDSAKGRLQNAFNLKHNKEAARMPAPSAAPSGGSTLNALPQGAKQIGTSGGKPVYQTPDGKKFIGD